MIQVHCQLTTYAGMKYSNYWSFIVKMKIITLSKIGFISSYRIFNDFLLWSWASSLEFEWFQDAKTEVINKSLFMINHFAYILSFQFQIPSPFSAMEQICSLDVSFSLNMFMIPADFFIKYSFFFSLRHFLIK
jgi:hypothetical protein